MIQNTSLGPCTTGIPACVLQGLGGGDFQLFDGSRGRSVFIQLDENLALMCAGQNRHGVENERVSQEGVATHPDPESCVAGREAAIEA